MLCHAIEMNFKQFSKNVLSSAEVVWEMIGSMSICALTGHSEDI